MFIFLYFYILFNYLIVLLFKKEEGYTRLARCVSGYTYTRIAAVLFFVRRFAAPPPSADSLFV